MSNMKLHPVKRRSGNGHVYCGPAALCSISNKPYEDVREVINQCRKRKPNSGITWMTSDEIGMAAYRLGFHYVIRKPKENPKTNSPPTLAHFLDSRTEMEANRRLIIHLTGHFVTVLGNEFIDNHTMSPVPISQAPHRRKKVQRYWVVL